MPFARGGVVDRPTVFPFAKGGIGLMGEAGPEAILPLKRIGGALGVKTAGGGTTVTIIDQRGANAPPVAVNQRRGPDGQQVIEVLVRDTLERILNTGQMDTTFAANFGATRRGRY